VETASVMRTPVAPRLRQVGEGRGLVAGRQARVMRHLRCERRVGKAKRAHAKRRRKRKARRGHANARKRAYGFAHPAPQTHVFVLARHLLSEACSFPLALRGSGAPKGARGGSPPLRGPVTQARRARSLALVSPRKPLTQSAHPGDARLSALHRGDFLAPSPPWRNVRALHMSGALRSRIGAFARSARSNGRAVLPGASRVLVTSQRAGRRSRPAHAVATSTQAGGTTGE